MRFELERDVEGYGAHPHVDIDVSQVGETIAIGEGGVVVSVQGSRAGLLRRTMINYKVCRVDGEITVVLAGNNKGLKPIDLKKIKGRIPEEDFQKIASSIVSLAQGQARSAEILLKGKTKLKR